MWQKEVERREYWTEEALKVLGMCWGFRGEWEVDREGKREHTLPS